MKKQIALALGVSFMSLPAFATKARLQALGEDVNGSQFISDNRNVFLNSATLNYHKDLVTMEWGDTTNSDDTENPRAEGGFFKSSGNMAYGVYLGSESSTANGLRTMAGVTNDGAAAAGTNALNEQNNVDLFFAGDAGVQWGANITYHSYADETNTNGDITSDSLRTRFGVISGDTSGFANISVVGDAEDKVNDNELEGGGAYQVGVSHNMGDVTYMAQVQSITADDGDGDEFSSQKTWLGAAKSYKVNDMANVWVSGWVKQDSYTCDFDAIVNNATTCGLIDIAAGDSTETYVPVTIAAEVSVKEWLTLRGSVTQNIYGEFENDGGDKKTMANSTVVNAGASLVFGDLQVDGVIGNSDETSDVNGDDTAGGDGTLRTDNVMSRVSMTYRF